MRAGIVTGRYRWIGALVTSVAMAAFPVVGACGTSPGGKLSIEASLDQSAVAPGGVATLTVQVRSAGLNLPDVTLPPLTADVERPNQPVRRTPVTAERAGTSQSFSMVNNAVERSATTVYRILPQSEGTIHIPPLRISVGKETAQSSPLTLTVSRTAASQSQAPSGAIGGPAKAPGGRPEVFVQATVDRSRVFWNQQLLLRLRLYSRVDILGDVDWKPPPTTGFWTEGLGPPRRGRVQVHGVPYEVMEIPTALFPTKTGRLTIGAAQVRVRVARVIQPPDPWSMLAMPEVVPQDLAITSDPVTVVVDPLPPGAPSGFQGAVGDYKLALHVDSLTVRAGDPVTVRATIRGTGNIATVRDPEIRARGATRQYVVGSSTKVDRSGDQLQGERETDVAFIAEQPGALTILPVAFVWFDPEGGRYRSQRSDSVRVAVLPGTGAPAQAGRVGQGIAAAAALRRKPGPFGSLSPDPPPASVALLGLSALAYGGALAVAGSRRKRLRDPRMARLGVLESLLAQDLSKADSLAARHEPARAAAIAEHALLRGLGIRYDVDLAGVARAERMVTLRSRGADETEISAVESLLDSLGAIAYAPPETRVQDARQAIRAVKERLERYHRELAS
jgi:oxygen tolerance protein BatD